MTLAPRRLLYAAVLVACVLPQVATAARTPGPDHGELIRGADGRVVQHARTSAWRSSPSQSATAKSLAGLRAELGRSWIAWDDTTALPHRIVLEGAAAPGVMASSAAAESMARGILARHLGMFAPGATLADFVLVTNDLSGGIRSVGFAQHHHAVPVYGGQISFRFKNDRLVAIANDALPNIAVRSGTLDAAKASSRALAWIRSDIAGKHHDVGAADPVVVMPLVIDGALEYREVARVPVAVDSPPSRWSVFVDTATGEPVARRQDLLFSIAGVVYRVPPRSPLDVRADYGAAFVDVDVDGVALVTDAAGVFDFATAPGQALNSPIGPFVAITNAPGELAAQAFVASPGSGTVWDGAADELVDAQLTAFVHTSVVKAYVRGIAPGLSWLDEQIPVTVNIEDSCNAFSDGNSINFYQSSEFCENTGLLADVVYHEFGHSVHHQSLLDGVGFFDVALSEGTSDYLSMTIVNDAGVARGFFYDQSPLRDNDPVGFEYRWPDDSGEVHDEGQIIAGALWDLRKLMIAKYGAAGIYATDRIWYESTRRAVNIPSMYVEALVVDDDDGNLANGTPNVCEINAAYGPHGLFTAGEASESVLATVLPEGVSVELEVALPNFPECPVGAAPTLSWRLRGGADTTELAMTATGAGWSALIPAQPVGAVVQYQVHVNYDNGTVRSLPDNFVDPWYELFIGEVVPLYCTNFTDGAAGWQLVGDWDVAAPQGTPGNRDPSTSWDADGVVMGNTLSLDGLYQPFSDAVATSPAVATLGFTNVRLQYRRWLSTEDGFFDQAEIFADDVPLWGQYASEVEELATEHHVDREWRFHDVDLSSQAADGTVAVTFSLAADGGVEFGGWTIDELCVVALDPNATSCGNGVVEAGEACDDGNLAAGDGCDPACGLEPTVPGDGTGGGSGEGGDDGGSSGGEDNSDPDQAGGLLGRGCGCNASAPADAGWAVGFGLVWWMTRRRR